ncbi:hypothetical protein [Nannocystis bainbridge]|uniref:Peripheral subunit-binding (PSBD) domain-containing protein n=1 Tax=Nannocystis bainbridge TaxID=2995303 RepID=A0ABT5EB31_9BACT|nr:hypothetical protein [Nannocystis bainbridge]MDC0721996.1 hypothetical protein [Nannocystis bainbridge]
MMLVFGTCLVSVLAQSPVELPAHEWRAPKAAKVAASEAAAPVAVKPKAVRKKVRRVEAARAGNEDEAAPAAVMSEVAMEDARAEGASVGKVTGSGAVLSVVMARAAGEAAEDSRGVTGEGESESGAAAAGDASRGGDVIATGAAAKEAAEVEGAAEARCELDVGSDGDPARWRRGRAQMFAGAAFLGIGVVGLGVTVSGWYVQRFSANELSRGTGYSDEALAPLRAQHARGESMLAAGAVTAVFGAVLGATLMATGARDVRAGRGGRWSSVRVAPSLGGLVLSGQF